MKDFRDFNRDIRILRKNFKFSREISGKVYKISVYTLVYNSAMCNSIRVSMKQNKQLWPLLQ